MEQIAKILAETNSELDDILESLEGALESCDDETRRIDLLLQWQYHAGQMSVIVMMQNALEAL